MTYLAEFKTQINARNFTKFLQLWEEYCTNDQVDVAEFAELLRILKTSDFAKSFGKIVETAIPFWQCVKDKKESYLILRLLIDLQTTNSATLADLALEALKERYGSDPLLNERLRLVGLRNKENFQGAISNYDLLAHMAPGKFVFHSGGWGVGEIMDYSALRQQISVEFEKVAGRKHFTFEHAFKALTPLPTEHFLVQRFANADELEKVARADAVKVIKQLLTDLGPKTASEIKDEMCGLVIPEEEWTKWWQAARTKLKKDPMIDSPGSLKECFCLRQTEVTQEELFKQALEDTSDIDSLIESAYGFLRDQPMAKKNPEIFNSLRDQLLHKLSDPELTPQQELQICICLESQFSHEVPGKETKALIQKLQNVEQAIHSIEIIAIKKRALALIREHREDHAQLLLNLLLTIKHSALKDYILKELSSGKDRPLLEIALKKLLQKPESHPEFFIWYFQKLCTKEDPSLPFADKQGLCAFLDGCLLLMNKIENNPDAKELIRKAYTFLSAKRYAIVRMILEGTSIEYLKEFLLLASKCHTLSEHDMKIFQSLAAVVQPSLAKAKTNKHTVDGSVIWTTEEALLKIQEKVRHIGTVEVIENAKEIEAARALGDLRENSEYKFALEKRSRLQGQLKTFSEQLKHARVITEADISDEEVSIGGIVSVADSNGKMLQYTILGPWDADADKNILSFQSKLAQAMFGLKEGDSFQFKDETFTVTKIKSYLG